MVDKRYRGGDVAWQYGPFVMQQTILASEWYAAISKKRERPKMESYRRPDRGSGLWGNARAVGRAQVKPELHNMLYGTIGRSRLRVTTSKKQHATEAELHLPHLQADGYNEMFGFDEAVRRGEVTEPPQKNPCQCGNCRCGEEKRKCSLSCCQW